MEMVLGFSIFGVELGSGNLANAQKLLLTLLFVLIVFGLRWLVVGIINLAWRGRRGDPIRFWVNRLFTFLAAGAVFVGVFSMWFTDPASLATALGLVGAAVVFSLQRIVASIAGNLVIVRNKLFRVGDHIRIGDVRGDVIKLGALQTMLIEVGQQPAEQGANADTWVAARQYTGRIVTVMHDKIFDQPLYNYTRDFPYLWDEISIPIPYEADRRRAEQIVLACAERHTAVIRQMGEPLLATFRQRYQLLDTDPTPKVYYRLTDNWLELTVRFLVQDHGIRELKDAISRNILQEFDAAGIGIASTTQNIVGFPPLRLQKSEATEGV